MCMVLDANDGPTPERCSVSAASALRTTCDCPLNATQTGGGAEVVVHEVRVVTQLEKYYEPNESKFHPEPTTPGWERLLRWWQWYLTGLVAFISIMGAIVSYRSKGDSAPRA